MEFTGEYFDAFRRDLKKATQELCEKYQIKMKEASFTYWDVDFTAKITFEKNEEGLNTERIQFETECIYYGFMPDDYLRLFELNGEEYELVGFDRKARKYKCVIRDCNTGERTRINDKFLHRLFEQEVVHTARPPREEQESSSQIIESQIVEEEIIEPQKPEQQDVEFQKRKEQKTESLNNETNGINRLNNEAKKSESQSSQPLEIDFEHMNLLTEKELSMLRIKLTKNKRNEKDWAQIKETMKGKTLLTFMPEQASLWVSSKEDIAVENGFLMVFTNKDDLDQHLEVLVKQGKIGRMVYVRTCTFEEIIVTADNARLGILFDITEETNRRYYTYDSDDQQIKASILSK